jgi:hypothetical protein
MKILFKLTSRSRRSNFLRAVDSIINNVTDKDNYHLLISLDDDDDSMKPLPVLNCPHTYKVYKKTESETITKISAINRDLNEFLEIYDAEIIINVSDDQIFITKGFDDIIRAEFYNDFNQYLHFNDGNQKSNVCTMHIVGREYYNRFKYIYHPDYISLWCDVENDIVAKQLGCYKYMGDDLQLFKHLHPAWGLAPQDALSIKTEDRALWVSDEITFNKRKIKNFGL